jgi:hypothetical protein
LKLFSLFDDIFSGGFISALIGKINPQKLVVWKDYIPFWMNMFGLSMLIHNSELNR